MLFYKLQRRNEPVKLMTNFLACDVAEADRRLATTAFIHSALQTISAVCLRKVKMTNIAAKTLISFCCIVRRAIGHFVDKVDLLLKHGFTNAHFVSPFSIYKYMYKFVPYKCKEKFA